MQLCWCKHTHLHAHKLSVPLEGTHAIRSFISFVWDGAPTLQPINAKNFELQHSRASQPLLSAWCRCFRQVGTVPFVAARFALESTERDSFSFLYNPSRTADSAHKKLQQPLWTCDHRMFLQNPVFIDKTLVSFCTDKHSNPSRDGFTLNLCYFCVTMSANFCVQKTLILYILVVQSVTLSSFKTLTGSLAEVVKLPVQKKTKQNKKIRRSQGCKQISYKTAHLQFKGNKWKWIAWEQLSGCLKSAPT